MSSDDEARFRIEMEDYMRGEWTLKRPQKPGVYPVCARHTPGSLSQMLVIYRHPMTKELVSTSSWSGWWWSEPHPSFPPNPDIDSKEGGKD